MYASLAGLVLPLRYDTVADKLLASQHAIQSSAIYVRIDRSRGLQKVTLSGGLVSFLVIVTYDPVHEAAATGPSPPGMSCPLSARI